MTREEAIEEVNKAFEPAFANYIITALTEGATVSDKEQGTAYIQAIYTEALEEGIRCAMCTNTIKSDTGCDGGCIVDAKMYNKVMTEINSRLLRRPPTTPQDPRWIPVTEKLPREEPNTYWVCTHNGCQCECRWTNVNPFWSYETTDWHWNIADIPQYTEVVAWRTLPSPYKAESEGK